MDCFSKYYDLFVGADYNLITDFLDSRIKKYKSDAELVCDLGCGTANVTEKMARLGYDMIGIDADEGMLMQAREKTDETVLLLNQDITDFELYGTVDVIYSTLDTLNYVLNRDDLDRLFSLVKNYLNYDGLFIFDINSEYKFKTVLGKNNFVYDDDEAFCCWQTEYNAESCLSAHVLTFFEKANNNTFVRSDSYQEQRFYSVEFINELAEKYSFDILEMRDNYSDKDVSGESERITFVLKINK